MTTVGWDNQQYCTCQYYFARFP